MLVNLLENSLKFTHIGGEININISKYAQSSIMISVEDTGIGMNLEDIESSR